MLSPIKYTFDKFTLSYALYSEPLYDGKQKPGMALNITAGFAAT